MNDKSSEAAHWKGHLPFYSSQNDIGHFTVVQELPQAIFLFDCDNNLKHRTTLTRETLDFKALGRKFRRLSKIVEVICFYHCATLPNVTKCDNSERKFKFPRTLVSPRCSLGVIMFNACNHVPSTPFLSEQFFNFESSIREFNDHPFYDGLSCCHGQLWNGKF